MTDDRERIWETERGWLGEDGRERMTDREWTDGRERIWETDNSKGREWQRMIEKRRKREWKKKESMRVAIVKDETERKVIFFLCYVYHLLTYLPFCHTCHLPSLSSTISLPMISSLYHPLTSMLSFIISLSLSLPSLPLPLPSSLFWSLFVCLSHCLCHLSLCHSFSAILLPFSVSAILSLSLPSPLCIWYPFCQSAISQKKRENKEEKEEKEEKHPDQSKELHVCWISIKKQRRERREREKYKKWFFIILFFSPKKREERKGPSVTKWVLYHLPSAIYHAWQPKKSQPLWQIWTLKVCCGLQNWVWHPLSLCHSFSLCHPSLWALALSSLSTISLCDLFPKKQKNLEGASMKNHANKSGLVFFRFPKSALEGEW